MGKQTSGRRQEGRAHKVEATRRRKEIEQRGACPRRRRDEDQVDGQEREQRGQEERKRGRTARYEREDGGEITVLRRGGAGTRKYCYRDNTCAGAGAF